MSAEPSHPYELLDVFTDSPLHGNQLAVFTEGEAVPSRLMQATARELRLSETVFLLPGDVDCDAHIRIFTPEVEMPFAGHPTLGAAFVVGEREDLGTVRLRTGAGIVTIALTRDHGDIIHGEMEQPIPTVEAYDREPDLLAALGVESSELPVELYCNGPRHLFVALRDAGHVAALTPDLQTLSALGDVGISCFARLDPGVGQGSGREPAAAAPTVARAPLKIKMRMFAPGLGVAEDPATGSAAGPLALHLVRHGWAVPAQTIELTQGVELKRPSSLQARVEGAPDSPDQILVGGAAVLVGRGHLRLQ